MEDGAKGNIPSSSNQAQPSRTNVDQGSSPTKSLAQHLAENTNINAPSQLQPVIQKKNKRKNGYGK